MKFGGLARIFFLATALMGMACPAVGQEICDDGIDNDGDGLVDCLDVQECYDLPCDDFDPCTERDICHFDSCRGVPMDCGWQDDCHQGVCVDGECLFEPVTGWMCDDGDPCTRNDTCEEGLCVGYPVTCESAYPEEITGTCAALGWPDAEVVCGDTDDYCNGITMCTADGSLCLTGEPPCGAFYCCEYGDVCLSNAGECRCPDLDHDGFFGAGLLCPDFDDEDCDDEDPTVYPGAAENCSDGLDNDCDGFVDGLDSDCAGCACPYAVAADPDRAPRRRHVEVTLHGDYFQCGEYQVTLVHRYYARRIPLEQMQVVGPGELRGVLSLWWKRPGWYDLHLVGPGCHTVLEKGFRVMWWFEYWFRAWF